MLKKHIIIFSLIIILFLIIFCLKIFFSVHNNNKSADEIEEYVLNIDSYEAKCTITVKSNKNTSTYEILEKYIKNPNIYIQEIQAPSNIEGTEIIYENNILTIKNSKLNLSNIYNNYSYIGDNNLSLICFINEYKEGNDKIFKETEEEIILETNIDRNIYNSKKTLYIDKETGNPKKLEIKDESQNTLIYIIYNEIRINDLKK